MSRLRPLIITILLLAAPQLLRAQMVVVDPSQIAASATTAAEQIDYMLDQLGELASLSDQLSGVRQYVEDVFGEDGIGGRAIGILNDLGTLTRLTEAFNNNIKAIQSYSNYIKQSQRYGLQEANTLLQYLNSARRDAETAIELSRKILAAVGFTKKDKRDALEGIAADLEKSSLTLDAFVKIEVETSLSALRFCELMDSIDEGMSSDAYVNSLRSYGTVRSTGRGVFGMVYLLLGLLSAVMLLWALVRLVQGNGPMNMAILRIPVALLVGTIALNVLLNFFGNI